MRIRHREVTLFGLVMFTVFAGLAHAADRLPQVVGEAVNSSNATVEGGALLPHCAIFSGDAVKVGEGGSVLLSFPRKGQASLAGSSQARFSSAEGNIVAQLLAGTVAIKRENKYPFVVKTSRYRVESKGDAMAEFLVALLPDNRTIVEAQHGKLAITETRSGESYPLAEGFLAEIPATAAEVPGQAEQQGETIGKVISSAGATLNGKPVPADGWVRDGDAVATGASGRALIQLLPTSQATLNENTTATFTRPVDRIWMHLQNGTMVVASSGENTPLVATTKFHIEPTAAVPARITVAVMADNSTSIESAVGDFRIGEIQSGLSFLLAAGKKVVVPADASGIPGLRPLGSGPDPASAQTTSSTPPQAPGASGTHAHTTLIIVGIAAAGGIVGAAVGLSGGGGGSGSSSPPPVSPTAP
jgi:ferric-dicitrate binding protein FerR (iron transport regulator)